MYLTVQPMFPSVTIKTIESKERHKKNEPKNSQIDLQIEKEGDDDIEKKKNVISM